MAYIIKLNINGKVNTYVRNGEPGLRDTTNALKVQAQQLRMLGRKDGATNEDYDDNEKNLAKFAVDFWKHQFTETDVIDGAVMSLKSLDSINDAIDDALGKDDSSNQGVAKKSRSRTSKKPSTPSMTSTKQDLQKVTPLQK